MQKYISKFEEAKDQLYSFDIPSIGLNLKFREDIVSEYNIKSDTEWKEIVLNYAESGLNLPFFKIVFGSEEAFDESKMKKFVKDFQKVCDESNKQFQAVIDKYAEGVK
jgi:hypothetical protein